MFDKRPTFAGVNWRFRTRTISSPTEPAVVPLIDRLEQALARIEAGIAAQASAIAAAEARHAALKAAASEAVAALDAMVGDR